MLKGKRELLARLERKMDAVVEAVVVDAFDRLQGRTPVLTGKMASNWRVGIGHADGSFSFSRDKGDVAAARAEAVAVAKRAKAGDAIFLTNAAPYAGKIDRERKLVRLTEAEMHRQFPRIVRQVARRR